MSLIRWSFADVACGVFASRGCLSCCLTELAMVTRGDDISSVSVVSMHPTPMPSSSSFPASASTPGDGSSTKWETYGLPVVAPGVPVSSSRGFGGSLGYGYGSGGNGAGSSNAQFSRRRWYLGIQSKKEPAHIMLEVYRALREGGFVSATRAVLVSCRGGVRGACFVCLNVCVCVSPPP